MKKIIVVLLIMSLILVSCGPSANQEVGKLVGDNNENVEEKRNESQNTIEKENNESENKITFEEKYKYTEIVTKPIKLEITNKPSPMIFLGDRGKLDRIPEYNEKNPDIFQTDFRGYDLRDLKIGEDKLDVIKKANFNTGTKWPVALPDGFNPGEIIEIGKNPGLKVRELHKQGITGKGVGVAILDQQLLVDHIEYKDRLKFYEEINLSSDDNRAQMHGAAVASIAVGKTVGVAPEADLYYIAKENGEYIGEEFIMDFTWVAMSIDRILEVNKTLPDDKKIKVISISVGWNNDNKGYKETMEAVKRAKEEGVFVISTVLNLTHGWGLLGVGREWGSDPDDYNSYIPGSWWERGFYSSGMYSNRILLVPADGRTTASPAGNEAYVHYPAGAMSWAVPYMAGLYALACQVKPDITPDEFLKATLETGDIVELERNGRTYKLEKIVNPVKLIERLKESN